MTVGWVVHTAVELAQIGSSTSIFTYLRCTHTHRSREGWREEGGVRCGEARDGK